MFGRAFRRLGQAVKAREKEIAQMFDAELQTDIDKVRLILEISDVLDEFSVKPRRTEKSSAEATRLKDLGNKKFQNKDYIGSLESYNKALLLAPPNEEIYSVCLANRSAVLLHLRDYSRCVRDIDLAIQCGYPKNNLYKLYTRKAKCQQFIQSRIMLEETVEQAREALEKSNLKDASRDVWLKDLDSLAPKSLIEADIETSKAPSLPDCHPVYPALSNTVGLEESAEFGRYVTASEDLTPGQVVMVERPYCSVTLDEFYKTHCCECQINVNCTPVPCRECGDVVYCSVECEKKAWQDYHSAECRFILHLKSLDLSMGHLALRTALKAGYDKLSAILDCEPEQASTDYHREDYTTIYLLQGHGDVRTSRDLFWRTAGAAYLCRLADLPRWSDNSNAREVLAAFILHNLQVLPCNAHEIPELAYNPAAPHSSSTLEIGSGIYPTLSFFNHSCDPTVIRSFYTGNACVVRTLSPVNMGEQLYDNYGALYAVHNVRQRQHDLSEQYYFTCCCLACVHDWKPYVEMGYEETPMYKCGTCQSLVVCEKCDKCSKKLDRVAINTVLSKAKSAFDTELVKLFDDSCKTVRQKEEMVKKMTVYSALVNRLVFRPYKTLNDCQEALKHVYNMLGNCTPVARVSPK